MTPEPPAPSVPRLIRAQPSTGRRVAGHLAALPPDLLEDAARRLGLVGLVFAAGNALGLGIEEVLRALGLMSNALRFERDLGETLGMALGIGVFWLSRRRVNPARLIGAGLAFEILGGLIVVFPEALTHVVVRPGAEAIGVSWLAVWIAICPILMPAPPALMVAAALAAAAMAPLSVWVATWGGHPWPEIGHQVFFYVPCFSVAVLSTIPATMMHRMRREVSEARALGSYQLEERLGGGGMGEVWRASHSLLARPAAIKLIGSGATANATPTELHALKQRFEREAQATASLSSPHTVALHDFGVADDGRFFFVMELLEGLDLERLVRQHGAQPPERVIHMLVQACESLEEAHARGMVHRDVKPSNLFASRIGGRHDFVKVLDFGLVRDPRKDDANEGRLTLTNVAIGTPSTMAPESVLGTPIDARADLYALGCVGYWLLTAREVFEGRSAVETMSLHAHAAPAAPSTLAPHPVPAALDQAILGCLEKEPEKRPQSASELAARLQAVPLERPWTEERAAEWWRGRGPW